MSVEKEVSEEKQDTELLEKLSLDTIKEKITGIRSGESDNGVFKKIIKDLKKASAPKQLAVGASAGWITGYLTMKIGKMAATAVGGSLLLLQIAHHKGYIKVDWNKMTNDTSSLADKMKDKLRLKSKSGFEKFQDFAGENIYVAGGFVGGFFLGIASS